MNETVNELIAFIKNPVLEKDENTTFLYRLNKFFLLFLISLLTSFFFTLFISALEESGLISTQQHAVESLLKKLSTLQFFIFAVLIAPVLEESIFRAPLTLFKKGKNFKIAFYAFAIAFGFIHITNYEITTSILLFSPLLIAPQVFAGLYFGFIRVKFGLVWSIALHATYNAFLFSLFLLAKNAIT
ncbi:MAG: membrane protease YdiL (CAAX protease family) [Polaribacter sp.]|jgi:membrane protease YdiL (CAAX protease family)